MKKVKKKNNSFSLKLIIVFLIIFVALVSIIVFLIIKMKEQDAINNFSAPGRYIATFDNGGYRELILRDNGSCSLDYVGINWEEPLCMSYIKSEGMIILKMFNPYYPDRGNYNVEYEILPNGNLSLLGGVSIFERQ